MENKLIEYSTAKLAKEKGFDEYYIDCYDTKGNIIPLRLQASEIEKVYCPAPIQSLLQKWLREKHKIDIIIIVNYNQHKQIKTYRCGIVYIKQLSDRQLIETFFIRPEGEKFLFIEFSTYEEALEIGLQEALKLI